MDVIVIVGVIEGVIEGMIDVGVGTVGVELIDRMRLGATVAVAVGVGVAIPQAANCIASVKRMN